MPDQEVHVPHYPTVEFVLDAVAGWINKYRQASSLMMNSNIAALRM